MISIISALANGFPLESEEPEVFRILLSILADLNAVIWMVFSRIISKFSNPFINPFMTVPSAPITIGITVTFMFKSLFLISLARSRYLSFFLYSFSFIQWSSGTARSTLRQVLLFLFYLFIYLVTINRSARLAEIKWSVFISKSKTILCVSFSKTDSELCMCEPNDDVTRCQSSKTQQTSTNAPTLKSSYSTRG